jgi:hypothetical protein
MPNHEVTIAVDGTLRYRHVSVPRGTSCRSIEEQALRDAGLNPAEASVTNIGLIPDSRHRPDPRIRLTGATRGEIHWGRASLTDVG